MEVSGLLDGEVLAAVPRFKGVLPGPIGTETDPLVIIDVFDVSWVILVKGSPLSPPVWNVSKDVKNETNDGMLLGMFYEDVNLLRVNRDARKIITLIFFVRNFCTSQYMFQMTSLHTITGNTL